MQPEPVTVAPGDSLAHALQLTRRHRVRHLPVVLPTGGLTGILSDRDIRLAMPSPLTAPDEERARFLEGTAVATVMTREVITVPSTETIEDAANLLCRHQIGALPVVDADGRLRGLLSETDILQALVQILGGIERSSRIEVALSDEPGSLARAIRIVGEDLRVNIVSMVVPSLGGQGRKTAVLHLQTIDPREVIGALEAAGFEVGWPALDADLRARQPE
jgi:acetoin utilization protein AcuB